MTLESSKILGGIGAIVMFIGVLPFFTYSPVISLVGAILVLAALHGVSGYFKDRGIFNNALYAFIIAIIGIIVVAVLVFAVILANIVDFVKIIYPGWDGNWASLQGMTPDTNAFSSGNFDPTKFFPLIGGLVAVWVVVWIVAIIGTFFLRRSLKTVTDKSTVGLFGTAGLLMLIGAFLGIIGIGYILVWIGALILAVAFFQLKPAPIEPAPSTAYQMPPPPTTV